MCIVFLSFETHPALFALLAFNRDEFLDRPTAPLHFWDDTLLAGKDLRAGGTWLGLTSTGRFACLTNFREVHYSTDRPDRLSRGALVVDFLTQGCSPAQYVQAIHHKRFDGYNVIVGDLATKSISYTSNRADAQATHLLPGLYGLSNGVLHQRGWPKVDKGLPRLRAILDRAARASRQPGNSTCNAAAASGSAAAASGGREAGCAPAAGAAPAPVAADGCEGKGRSASPRANGSCEGAAAASSAHEAHESQEHAGFELPWDELFGELLGDPARVENPEQLPQTGVDPQHEHKLSGIFVEPFPVNGGLFGTRSQTVVAIWKSGRVEARERSLDAERGTWQEVSFAFDITPSSLAPSQRAAAEC